MIAVSIFISQSENQVSIKSIAADDAISKAVERMLCEQAANVLRCVDAAVVCAEAIKSGSEKQP